MTTIPNFRSDSVAGRCIAFFKANPEEELSLDDIVDKFDATRGNIHTLLTAAREAGLLDRYQNTDSEWIYRAGSKLATSGVNIDTAPSAPPQRRRTPAPAVDLPSPDEVEIRDDVPLPGHKQKRDWLPLLKRLTKPGQSASLPLAAKHTLSQALTQARKDKLGEFTTRTNVAAGTVTVWRTA